MATPAYLLPGNEAARLRALGASAVADAFAEPVYQQLVEVVARAYQLPSTFLSTVGAEQVDFPATHGVPGLCALPREESLCALAVRQQHPLVLNHLLTAPANAHQRTAQRLGLAAYVGVPVLLGEGLAVGVLCLGSPVPREFSPHELVVLEELAALISELLAVRRHLPAPHWQAVQQLVVVALRQMQHLLDHLARHNQGNVPTPTAVLNALQQRLQIVREMLPSPASIAPAPTAARTCA
ncbi:MAG TPA: GAF domain-containing protein [Hymenobacter sp.]|uniref:GAF domain-containing protein n=1 Tax=Hymenobacter sp. TaxID=1898978 RepID=UPI002D7E5F22|nr:GAF domain-containing protein [Hymenobacter sp.]HET9504403.1 GAF domain-containing protein [Hymenobacter sp.]